MQKSLCHLSIIGLLAFGMATGTARAQDSTPPPAQTESGHHRGMMSPDEQLKHLTQTLNLSADQQSQIKPLLESSHQQMMQVHQDQSLSREDRMTKMKTIMDDTHTKIEAVLNDQQKQQFESMRQKQQGHMHGGGEGPQ
jgi:periplasmic protein CpxP/Spy